MGLPPLAPIAYLCGALYRNTYDENWTDPGRENTA